MSKNIIAGLDIGSNTIRLAVGKIDPKDGLQLIGIVNNSAKGIYKGVISNIDDAVLSISQCVEKAEQLAGTSIKEAIIGISGSYITSQYSKGVVAVAKTNGEIQEDDVERSIEAARMVSNIPNYEILHVLPRMFFVDNQTGIKDPIGMTGLRLEVETVIIQAISVHIKNLTKCIYRAGLKIKDLVFSPLATAENILTEKQKGLGVALVNIGSVTTSLIVLEDGNVMHVASLAIGSEHITCDIAIGLRVPVDIAERVKLEHGTCLSKNVSKKEQINLLELGGEDEKVNKKYICQIIEARIEEILQKIDMQLKKIDRSGTLPAGIVFVGGGAKLPGLIELAKKRLCLPVKLGAQDYMPTSQLNKNIFSDLSSIASVGLIHWGSILLRQEQIVSTSIGSKITEWFKTFKI